MGQPVLVKEVESASHPGSFRYETNRPLTGMGHRSYSSAEDATDPDDPADELARRLFALSGVEHVHIYGNVVTVDMHKGFRPEGVAETIERLFRHY